MVPTQPRADELIDPPVASVEVGGALVTVREWTQGAEVWLGVDGGISSWRAMLPLDFEPVLARGLTAGPKAPKPLGGLFAPWTPVGDRSVRLVVDGLIVPAVSGGSAWVTVCRPRDAHATWIEYLDCHQEVYLRRRLDSIRAFVGARWQTPLG